MDELQKERSQDTATTITSGTIIGSADSNSNTNEEATRNRKLGFFLGGSERVTKRGIKRRKANEKVGQRHG
jgi:hypothetical protein